MKFFASNSKSATPGNLQMEGNGIPMTLKIEKVTGGYQQKNNNEKEEEEEDNDQKEQNQNQNTKENNGEVDGEEQVVQKNEVKCVPPEKYQNNGKQNEEEILINQEDGEEEGGDELCDFQNVYTSKMQINDREYLINIGKTDENKIFLQLIDSKAQFKPFYYGEFSLDELKKTNQIFTDFSNLDGVFNYLGSILNNAEKSIKKIDGEKIEFKLSITGEGCKYEFVFSLIKSMYSVTGEYENKAENTENEEYINSNNVDERNNDQNNDEQCCRYSLDIGKTDENKIFLKVIDNEDQGKNFYYGAFSLEELREISPIFNKIDNEDIAIQYLSSGSANVERNINEIEDENIKVNFLITVDKDEFRFCFTLIKYIEEGMIETDYNNNVEENDNKDEKNEEKEQEQEGEEMVEYEEYINPNNEEEMIEGEGNNDNNGEEMENSCYSNNIKKDDNNVYTELNENSNAFDKIMSLDLLMNENGNNEENNNENNNKNEQINGQGGEEMKEPVEQIIEKNNINDKSTNNNEQDINNNYNNNEQQENYEVQINEQEGEEVVENEEEQQDNNENENLNCGENNNNNNRSNNDDLKENGYAAPLYELINTTVKSNLSPGQNNNVDILQNNDETRNIEAETENLEATTGGPDLTKNIKFIQIPKKKLLNNNSKLGVQKVGCCCSSCRSKN